MPPNQVGPKVRNLQRLAMEYQSNGMSTVPCDVTDLYSCSSVGSEGNIGGVGAVQRIRGRLIEEDSSCL
jgi:hypothetical protein